MSKALETLKHIQLGSEQVIAVRWMVVKSGTHPTTIMFGSFSVLF